LSIRFNILKKRYYSYIELIS